MTWILILGIFTSDTILSGVASTSLSISGFKDYNSCITAGKSAQENMSVKSFGTNIRVNFVCVQP
jgi:hypothetical protein